MRVKSSRHEAIKTIVRKTHIKTQKALVDELKLMGYDCTQATVSRDITDMGLRKVGDGMYVLAEDLHLRRMAQDLLIDITQVDNLVILKAAPGTAPGIAAAIDAAHLEGMVGSVSGDDTVLIISSSAGEAAAFVDALKKIIDPQEKRHV